MIWASKPQQKGLIPSFFGIFLSGKHTEPNSRSVASTTPGSLLVFDELVNFPSFETEESYLHIGKNRQGLYIEKGGYLEDHPN